jgi:isoleucyl-tRNA synthetase
VWWVFAELVKKNLVYKDRRVSLYCTRCATPLSNFEVSMGDSYADKEDPAVTVKFKVRGEENTYLLAWTTTPWTLPANVGLAVHPDLTYVKVYVRDTSETLIFAEDRLNDVLSQYFPLEDPAPNAAANSMPFQVVGKVNGTELVGMTYEGLYDFSPLSHERHVVAADYVSANDGTGIVHQAPAFGEEDMKVGKAHNFDVLETLDAEGRFVAGMPWSGEHYRDANEPIMADLAARGLLYRRDTITHSVPICWRCSSTLIYRAQPAWFVDVTKLKPKLLRAAEKINWHPEHFKEGRFGKGLEGAPDWNISRTRYWGAPLPVWECDLCTERVVVSSLAELKKKATVGSFPAVLDPHRPAIDEVTLSCKCGGVMRRIPEVFDCWFESGSMPFATAARPGDVRPADFIGEAQDQTRGWFYVLHVLSVALTGKAAFKDVVVTGLIMAEDGKKMSKSLKNYPDPWDILTQYGADALRLYILSSPVVDGEQLNFSTRELDEMQRKVLALLWNVTTFYKTYAGNDAVELAKPRSAHALDRWLYARLHTTIRDITKAYEGYDLVRAVRPLRGFVDDLSTWWLRRSRERMKDARPEDRMDALKTLREVLLDLSALLAPAAPFLAEKIYLDLGGSKASVHLEKWPVCDLRLIDERLLNDMRWVREAAAAGLEQRAATKMPVRQALASATVAVRDANEVGRLADRTDLLALLRDELNVEVVLLAHDADAVEARVTLDTNLTPELKEKGMARELVRQVMALRKQAKCSPGDRIHASVATKDAALREVLERLGAGIAKDVKADELSVGETLGDVTASAEMTLDGTEIMVGIRA